MWVRLVIVASVVTLASIAGGCAARSTDQNSGSGVSNSVGVATPGYVGAPTGTDGGVTGELATAPSVSPSKGGVDTAAVADQKLVVVNKTLRIETEDVQAAVTKIRDLATRDGGDITNMQVSQSVDQPVYPLDYNGSTKSSSSVPLRAYVTIRVPASTYAAFIADAAKLGHVLFQSESADDVTQQHVDMQARLENLKAEQSRLRQLFAKANKVSDMLAIEQELTRVQGDIEAMQAQVKYLERQAAMATVTVELVEPTPLLSPAGNDWGIRAAFTDAVRAFVGTMNDLIVTLGPVLALLIFVGLPAWLIVWVVRRVMRRRRTTAVAASPVAVQVPTDGSSTGPTA